MLTDVPKSTRRPYWYVLDNGYFCDCDTLNAMQKLLQADMLCKADANQLLDRFYTEVGYQKAIELLKSFSMV